MNIAISKITSKSQTVIPKEVRERLGLSPGDKLKYTLTATGISIAKVESLPLEDPFVVFTEWSSDADEKAYANL